MWESVLIGGVALLVGVLGTVAAFAGRVARLEAKCEENEREHKAFSGTLASIEGAQRETLGVLYELAAKSGVRVR